MSEKAEKGGRKNVIQLKPNPKGHTVRDILNHVTGLDPVNVTILFQVRNDSLVHTIASQMPIEHLCHRSMVLSGVVQKALFGRSGPDIKKPE